MPVLGEGKVDFQSYCDVLKSLKNYDLPVLVSMMHANNETGVIQDIALCALEAKKYGFYFHSDLTQSCGKIPVSFSELQLDYASITAHKLGGIKGTGALLIKENAPFLPVMTGGGQENGLRGGTESVVSIIALGKAIEKIQEYQRQKEEVTIEQIRDAFEERFFSQNPTAKKTTTANRLPNTSHILLSGIVAQELVKNVAERNCVISSGSACHQSNLEPSHVLLAMGLSEMQALSAIRVSFGFFSTIEDAIDLADILSEEIELLY